MMQSRDLDSSPCCKGEQPHAANLDGKRSLDVKFADVKIGKKLGTGSSADVFKGSFRGEQVAVKKMKSLLRHDKRAAEKRKLFLQEMDIWSQIDHPNIVAFKGAIRTDPTQLAIITECVEGGNLYEHLHGTGGDDEPCQPISKPVVLKMCYQIASALRHLHDLNIIHRDLKSSNLLIDADSNLKLVDFGLSRYEDPEGIMTGETGSYRWTAPEVLRHERYCKACDVYSFAIVAWEIITCSLPYADLKPMEAAIGVAQNTIRPYSLKGRPNCPPALAQIIYASWQEDPSSRPTFAQIVDLLEAIFHAETLPLPTPKQPHPSTTHCNSPTSTEHSHDADAHAQGWFRRTLRRFHLAGHGPHEHAPGHGHGQRHYGRRHSSRAESVDQSCAADVVTGLHYRSSGVASSSVA